MVQALTQPRYNFYTIDAGYKLRSEMILKQILNNIDRKGIFVSKFKGLEVGKMAKISNKIGRVSLINIIGKRMLVWLEIPLPVPKYSVTGHKFDNCVHYGVEIFIK